jgi:hypothetical protein
MVSVWYGIETVAAAYSICAMLNCLRSLQVCLPIVNCSLTVYMRVLLLPVALTASATFLYRIMGSTAPDRDVINVCLAVTLATIASAVALIAQRRRLLEALKFAG